MRLMVPVVVGGMGVSSQGASVVNACADSVAHLSHTAMFSEFCSGDDGRPGYAQKSPVDGHGLLE
jgi:hypothetical protein